MVTKANTLVLLMKHLKVGIIGPTNMRKLTRLTGKPKSFFLKKAEELGRILAIHGCELWVNSDGGMPGTVALSYKKPFLLSRQLSGYFQSPDFQSGLIKTKLKNEDLIFDPNILDFNKKLKNIRKKINKAKILSTYLYNQRKWSKIAPLYISLLKLNENK